MTLSFTSPEIADLAARLRADPGAATPRDVLALAQSALDRSDAAREATPEPPVPEHTDLVALVDLTLDWAAPFTGHWPTSGMFTSENIIVEHVRALADRIETTNAVLAFDRRRSDGAAS